ncbi:MAG: Ig-like domain-containing protein [Thermoplasmatota archaeon]
MTETSDKNNRRMGWSPFISTLAVILLVGTALMSLMLIAPVSNAEPANFEDLLTDMTITPGDVYTTSEQYILFDYNLRNNMDDDFGEIHIVLTVVNDTADPAVSEEVYTWNKTAQGGVAPTQISWYWDETAPAALVPNDYHVYMNITVYDPVIGFYFDEEMVNFTVKDGSDMIRDIMIDPTSVVNDGMGEVDLTWTVNRMASDLDDTGEVYFNLWYDGSMVWEENLTLEEVVNDPANMTYVDNGDHMIFTYTYTVPEMGMVGAYDLVLNGTDDFGYKEMEIEEDAFTVGWMELPARQVEDTIEFHEDMYAVADLADFFMDYNDDPLSFYPDMSMLENITATMVSGVEYNFTAPMNWYGQESFEIAVNDTKSNETFTIDVVVSAVNDPVAPAEMRTVYVPEDDMEASFNPLDLFYDPDDEIDYNVSLGVNIYKNETNVTVYDPIWTFEDDNFTVTIDMDNNTMGMAVLKTDIEEGEAVFPLSLWMTGDSWLNTTGTVMVDPVNDMPVLTVTSIEGYKNEVRTVDLDNIFTDADGPMLNYSDVSGGANIVVAYNNVTHVVTITPAADWTGDTTLSVNVTDTVDYMVYSIPVSFMERTYTVSGHVEFVDAETYLADVDNESKIVTVIFHMGNDTYMADTNMTTGNYSIVLAMGVYTMSVEFALDDEYVYEADVRSGYMADLPDSVNVTEDMEVDIDCNWETVTLVETATWDDIDFDNHQIDKEGDEYNVTVPVKEGSEDKVGFENIVVRFVIVNDDDEKLTFNMTWHSGDMKYYVFLTEEDLEDVKKGKLDYYFTDVNEEIEEGAGEKTFKSDDNADLITIIVLVVLIVLVLVALVFIMRKPAEEEFEDEEEEEEESSERICPGCGETVTDEDAEECPYCGDTLEEE